MTRTTRSRISKVLKGSVFVLIGNIIGTSSVFISRIFLGRYLGSSQYGIFILGITATNMLTLVALLGVPSALLNKNIL